MFASFPPACTACIVSLTRSTPPSASSPSAHALGGLNGYILVQKINLRVSCGVLERLEASWGHVVSWCLFSDPKPIENPSKNLQNPPPKRSKSRSRRDCVLGRIFVLILVRFEASLGPSWERLGASRGVLGASWGRLGGSWARLGGMFGRLGRVLERPGRVLGASWRVLGASSPFASIC